MSEFEHDDALAGETEIDSDPEADRVDLLHDAASDFETALDVDPFYVHETAPISDPSL